MAAFLATGGRRILPAKKIPTLASSAPLSRRIADSVLRRTSLSHNGRPSALASSGVRSFSVLSSPSFSRMVSPKDRSKRYNPHANTMMQRRQASTWLPEALSSFSVWGGSGWVLKTLHMEGALPYWACFIAINVLVRVCLVPLVLHGAHTAGRFAKVVPEVQFLVSLFSNDMKQMQQRKASVVERWSLMRTNLQSLGGIYKLHNINPFAVFLSPLMQLPIFWYVSVDLRKIVNGLDPQLAQALVESPVAWIPDLTEPDPWFGLPVLAGVLLYANVEVAVGRRSLAGPATAKADTALVLKDVFQSFAVFMPCFTSQMPAGIQIYLVTSFLFTMGQSASLRNAAFRSMVGLSPLPIPGEGNANEARYAQEFIRLKQLEQKAREIRGDGPLLGKGVLAQNFECSFPGTYRKSSIEGSGMPRMVELSTQASTTTPEMRSASLDLAASPFSRLPYVHGVSAPAWQLVEQKHHFESPAPVTGEASVEDQQGFSDEIMAKANRGELPVATKLVDPTQARRVRRTPVKVNQKRNKGSRKKKR